MSLDTLIDTAPPKAVQRWSASDYARNGRFVQELAGPIFGMLGAKPGERILDLGCGDGALTAEIKASGGRLLTEGGFTVREIKLVPRPTLLKTGMEGWLRTFGRSFFDQFPEPERTQVVGEVAELLRPSLCDSKGTWTADHIRLRFFAERGA